MSQPIIKSNDPRGGFAIGLILLAIVLIAAIVAAIAISSRDSGSSAQSEEDRVLASALVQTGIEYANAAARYDALGYQGSTDAEDQLGSGTDDTAHTTADRNGQDASLAALLESSNNGGTFETLPEPPDGVGGGTFSVQVDGDNNDVYLVLDGVEETICRQVNSILWNYSGDLENSVDLSSDADPAPVAIDGGTDTRIEGCVDSDANDSNDNAYYFKRLLRG